MPSAQLRLRGCYRNRSEPEERMMHAIFWVLVGLVTWFCVTVGPNLIADEISAWIPNEQCRNTGASSWMNDRLSD